MVTWTCKQVNPETIVSQRPLPLSQPVLLSLIQQLAYNFEKDVEIKLTWLEKVTICLDPSDTYIAPHVPQILEQVIQSLGRAYKTYHDPKNKISHRVKMLIHVVNSLLMEAKGQQRSSHE